MKFFSSSILCRQPTLLTILEKMQVSGIWQLHIYVDLLNITESGWRSLYSDLLRAGRSGDRISAGAKFSAPIQTGSEDHPASPSGVKAAGSWCWPPTPHLVPKFKEKSRAISLLSQRDPCGLNRMKPYNNLYIYVRLLAPTVCWFLGNVTFLMFDDTCC